MINSLLKKSLKILKTKEVINKTLYCSVRGRI